MTFLLPVELYCIYIVHLRGISAVKNRVTASLITLNRPYPVSPTEEKDSSDESFSSAFLILSCILAVRKPS